MRTDPQHRPLHSPSHRPIASIASQRKSMTASPPLSSVVKDYIRARHGKVRFERLRQAEHHLLSFIQTAGDKPVSEYRRKEVERFVAELVQAQGLSASTVNGYLASLSALFNWVTAHSSRYGLHANPCKGCRLPSTIVAAEQRQQSGDKPFSREQLRTFFESEESLAGIDTPYKYWIPLIQLFTGARIGEICQLKPGDFVLLRGCIPALQFLVSNSRRHAARAVPLHPKLIELGFIAYAESLEGHDTLWPGLKIPYAGSKGQNLGMWLDRHLKKLGLKCAGRRTDVFRSTFVDRLKRQGVGSAHSQALLGQADANGGSAPQTPLWMSHPNLLLNAIAKLDYGVEFENYRMR